MPKMPKNPKMAKKGRFCENAHFGTFRKNGQKSLDKGPVLSGKSEKIKSTTKLFFLHWWHCSRGRAVWRDFFCFVGVTKKSFSKLDFPILGVDI
jgi:hypothetical protein